MSARKIIGEAIIPKALIYKRTDIMWFNMFKVLVISLGCRRTFLLPIVQKSGQKCTSKVDEASLLTIERLKILS